MIPNIKLSVKRVGICLYDDRRVQIYFISISYIYIYIWAVTMPTMTMMFVQGAAAATSSGRPVQPDPQRP